MRNIIPHAHGINQSIPWEMYTFAKTHTDNVSWCWQLNELAAWLHNIVPGHACPISRFTHRLNWSLQRMPACHWQKLCAGPRNSCPWWNGPGLKLQEKRAALHYDQPYPIQQTKLITLCQTPIRRTKRRPLLLRQPGRHCLHRFWSPTFGNRGKHQIDVNESNSLYRH